MLCRNSRTTGAAEDDLRHGETLSDLLLVICSPNYARTLDEDFFEDDLADGGGLPGELLDALEAFNEAISGIVLSWYPGKFALRIVKWHRDAP